jgi:hypothetical protein
MPGSKLVHGFVWENNAVPIPHAWVQDKRNNVIEVHDPLLRTGTYVGRALNTSSYMKTLLNPRRHQWAFQAMHTNTV